MQTPQNSSKASPVRFAVAWRIVACFRIAIFRMAKENYGSAIGFVVSVVATVVLAFGLACLLLLAFITLLTSPAKPIASSAA